MSVGRSSDSGPGPGHPGQGGVRRDVLSVHDRPARRDREQGDGDQPRPRCPPERQPQDECHDGDRGRPDHPGELATHVTVGRAPPRHEGDHPEQLEPDVGGVGDRRPERAHRLGRPGVDRMGRGDTGRRVLDRPQRREHGASQRDGDDQGRHRAPARRGQPSVGEADHRERGQGQRDRQRPHTQPAPPRAGAGGGRVPDLSAQEHHPLDDAGRHEQQPLAVPGALEEHVGTDGRERQGQQAVVQVGQPEPPGQAEGDHHDDEADQQQGHEAAQSPGVGSGHALIVARRRPRRGQGFPCFSAPGFSPVRRRCRTAERGSQRHPTRRPP